MGRVTRVMGTAAVLLASRGAAASGGGASDSTEAPGSPRADSGALRVAVDSKISDADVLPGWILARNEDLRLALELPEHEQWIEVEITGATYDYRITVVAMRDGLPLGEDVGLVHCECNNAALLERVDEQIARAIEVAWMTPVEESVIEPPVKEEPPRPIVEPPRRRLTGVGIGGIVTASLGLVAVGAGAGIAAKGEVVQPTHPGGWVIRDFEPLGFAALSVGVMAMAAGTTMLVLDLKRCRRNPAARGCASVDGERVGALVPRRKRPVVTFTAGRVFGLSVQGRF